MTLRKPLPEIARCACRRRVDSLESDSHHHRVWCYCGWKGPWRLSVRNAIIAWNRVMGTCRAVRNLVGLVNSAENDYRRGK